MVHRFVRRVMLRIRSHDHPRTSRSFTLRTLVIVVLASSVAALELRHSFATGTPFRGVLRWIAMTIDISIITDMIATKTQPKVWHSAVFASGVRGAIVVSAILFMGVLFGSWRLELRGTEVEWVHMFWKTDISFLAVATSMIVFSAMARNGSPVRPIALRHWLAYSALGMWVAITVISSPWKPLVDYSIELVPGGR